MSPGSYTKRKSVILPQAWNRRNMSWRKECGK